VTAFEYRRYELMCNSLALHADFAKESAFFRAPREAASTTTLAALRKLAAKEGWTHVRGPYGRKHDKDYCPAHKPAEAGGQAAQAAGTEG
jgi:hypothetical protein